MYLFKDNNDFLLIMVFLIDNKHITNYRLITVEPVLVNSTFFNVKTSCWTESWFPLKYVNQISSLTGKHVSIKEFTNKVRYEKMRYYPIIIDVIFSYLVCLQKHGIFMYPITI